MTPEAEPDTRQIDVLEEALLVKRVFDGVEGDSAGLSR
jgi:hypothetical protein